MNMEPYHWLDAIENRREYVLDRLKGATPVFAVSRPEGILLLGRGIGHSKVFEIYDRHALAVLGNPVDIEKLRQTAIEAAHTEGFQRAPQDVTLNRLVSFALGPALKNSFEQIHVPPLIVESILAELGDTPEEDKLARLHFDGRLKVRHGGVTVAFANADKEAEAENWVRERLDNKGADLPEVTKLLLRLWDALVDDRPIAELEPGPPSERLKEDDRRLEAALLDRNLDAEARYRQLDPSALGLQT